MNIYAQYCLEKLNRKFFELDGGFISYDIRPPEVYIADFYVTPEQRQKGLGRQLFDQTINEAKNNNCKFLTCQVELDRPNPELSLLVILGDGFKFRGQQNNNLHFYKEIL